MQDFFDQLMEMGRYPDLTRKEVFVRNRQYFDQILYKNHKFRHEYAQAYQAWALAGNADRATRQKLLPLRIEFAIDLMGEDEIRALFRRVLDAAVPAEAIPDDLDFRDTLPGGTCDADPSHAALMEPLRRFWLRLALPDVWEEDEL